MVKNNLFANSDVTCNVTPTETETFTFVDLDVCEIPKAPEPLFTCQTPLLLPEPNTDVGIKCPEFSTVTTVRTGFNNTDGTSCLDETTLVLRRTDVDPCKYELELDLAIPIPRLPCPVINTSSSVQSGYNDEGCLTGGNKFSITTKHTPPVDCDDPGTCEFDIELEILIPIPRAPCPIINSSGVSVQTGYDIVDCLTGNNKLEITTKHTPPVDCNDPGTCEFEIEIEIVVPIPVPPCPIINTSGISVQTGYDDEGCLTGENKFEITTRHAPPVDCNDPGTCEFDIEIEIVVPIPRPPCPIINTSGSVSTGYDIDGCLTGENKFKITTNHTPGDCNNPAQCEFDIEIEIVVPIPLPPCPIINTSSSFQSGYDIAGCLTGENKFKITTKHTPPANCNDPGTCEFDIELEVVFPIPVPPCPIINSSGVSVQTGYDDAGCLTGENKFEITTKHTPSTNCNDPGTCEFDIEIEIVVPIPRVPCPVINTSSSVQSGYNIAGCLTGENKFEITTRHTPPVDCNDPGQCEFDIELEIVIPIPAVPCPIINTSSSFQSSYATNNSSGGSGSGSCLTGESKFEITTAHTPGDCDNPGQCEFEITLDVVIPIPRVPCPIISATASFKSGYKTQPTSQPPTQPAYCGEPGTELPCLTGENKFEITTKHTPPVDCNDPGQCEFDILLDIVVPIPRVPCPIISASVSLQSGYATAPTDPADPTSIPGNTLPGCLTGKNKFEITTSHALPVDCDDPGQCEFDILLDIVVPIPRVPCPVINAELSVQSGYATAPTDPTDPTSIPGNALPGCLTGDNKFNITTKHTAPVDCDDPGKCEFDIELAIVIPIPRAPCPVINTALSVQSSYASVADDSDNNDLASCLTGENRFSITTKHIPPED